MRNKKKRLAMIQQMEAEFKQHQAALKAVAEEKAKAEAAAKAKAEAAAKAKAEAAAKAKAEAAAKAEELVHSQELASPEASKTSAKKSKTKTKKASK